MTTLEYKKSDLSQPTFVWVSEHQKAFNTLKVSLTTAPVLGYPDRCLIKRAGSCSVPSR